MLYDQDNKGTAVNLPELNPCLIRTNKLAHIFKAYSLDKVMACISIQIPSKCSFYWPNYYKGHPETYQAQRGREEIALPINKLGGIWGLGG